MSMESDIPIQLQVVQEIQAHSSSGQSVQLGQPRYVESPSGQEEPSQAEWGLSLPIDTDFLKSPICHIKIAEFVVLLGAWTTIMKFSKDLQQEYRYDSPDEKEADIFKFITVFCWVMVILYLAFNTISVPKICACRWPSLFSLMSLIFNFIMFALLLACTGNLVRWTDLWGQWLQRYVDEIEPKTFKKQGNAFRSILVSLGVASALGVLSCVFFVVDMVLNYKLFQTQRAQETPPDQGPPQRRVWDINTSFVRSPLFYMKMAKFVSLFVAWACIIKYKNTALEFKDYKPVWEPTNEWLFLKTGFFEDVTISSWVMVILLALTSLLSFDKLFSRSSSWTLTILFISLILFMLMIASCGYLTFWAVKLESQFTSLEKVYGSKNFLYTGLGFGFLACLLFIVDMVLDCKMYQTHQAQETPPDQEPPRRRAGDVNKNYLRCPVFYVKLAEISSLFVTWVGILMYLYYFDQWEYTFPGSKAVFFRGVTIFSWAMVIFLTLTSVFSFDKICKRSSSWTLMKLIIYFILTILLIASCGSLTPQTIFWKSTTAHDEKTNSYILALVIALACGFLSCVLFVVDMVLNYKMYQTQRAQETPPDQRAPQRQGGDVNTKYLRSSVFYVKLAEIVFLLVAWVCIVNYFYFFLVEHMWDVYLPDKDLKADIFKGITVFCWAMVNILTLTSVFSFDKLCSRSSRWTLTTLIIYLILSILLIACCGNLTPRAVDLRREYYASLPPKEYEGWPAISLVIGIAFGYLSWLIFIVDIFLLFKLYRKQRTEEVHRPQQAEQVDQPLVTRQALVVTDCSAKLDFATCV